VAVISDILRAENPGKRARQYLDLLENRVSGRGARGL
jgi:thiamine monophosphate synthase